MQNAEDTFWFGIFPIICYVGSALLLSYIAGRKNRSKWGWGLIGGLALVPALIILLILPRLDPQAQAATGASDSSQQPTTQPTCPACRATISPDASECPNCGKGIF